MINKIDNIISEYSAKGIQLTVRQCYYQCVSRGIMHNNSASYTKISELIADGRLAGLLDWDAIEDRTRYTRENSHWISPKEIIDDAVEMYQIDTRATQPIYVECWIEKDSLVSILEETCRRLDVPCCSCRGFPSITMLHEASQRFQEHDHSVLLYAGDHDPSGLTIPESIKKALTGFLGEQDQVPPVFSAKMVNGVRAYEFARAGEAVELKSSKIDIDRIELLSFTEAADSPTGRPRAEIVVGCRKGTYIRSPPATSGWRWAPEPT